MGHKVTDKLKERLTSRVREVVGSDELFADIKEFNPGFVSLSTGPLSDSVTELVIVAENVERTFHVTVVEQ